ncbi:MAG: NAD-dependent epimerase/dehydratase family protein [Acidobacteriota bacterium]
MKVLVLGASGFIGSHIARELLKENFNVRVLIRKTSNIETIKGLNLEIYYGDLFDRDSITAALKNCNFLIHSAGHYPKFSLKMREELEIARIQIRNVLDAALSSKIEKMIYTSSLSTLGKGEKRGSIINENHPYNLQNVRSTYHRIKYTMEKEVFEYTRKGLPAVVLNPTFCIGEYDFKPPEYCIISRIVNKQVPAYIQGEMNAVDVKDVARGHVLALKQGRIGERYILGNKNMTTKEFLFLVSQLAGVKPPKIKIPYRISLLAGYLSETVAFLLKKRPFIPLSGIYLNRFSSYMNSSKAIKELGFPQSPLEDAIKRAIKWYYHIGYIKPR